MSKFSCTCSSFYSKQNLSALCTWCSVISCQHDSAAVTRTLRNDKRELVLSRCCNFFYQIYILNVIHIKTWNWICINLVVACCLVVNKKKKTIRINFHGGLFLPPICQINYVNRLHLFMSIFNLWLQSSYSCLSKFRFWYV